MTSIYLVSKADEQLFEGDDELIVLQQLLFLQRYLGKVGRVMLKLMLVLR